MKIEGHTFVVTGGASGLGEAVVRRLCRLGGRCAILDMCDQAQGEAVVQAVGGAARCLFAHCNVTDEASVVQALDAIGRQWPDGQGAIHGVINCAGIATPRRVISSRGTVHGLDGFNKVLAVNVAGTFNVVRLAAARMQKQAPTPSGDRGVIINIASVAAFEGQIGQAAYSASKGAVVAMTLPIARELGQSQIRVNCIAPGIFGTPLMKALPQKAQESLSKQVPCPSRLGEPDEFAHSCQYLIENAYMNGTCLRVDGAIRMSAM